MPTNRKKKTRTRMSKTGERYQQALRYIRGDDSTSETKGEETPVEMPHSAACMCVECTAMREIGDEDLIRTFKEMDDTPHEPERYMVWRHEGTQEKRVYQDLHTMIEDVRAAIEDGQKRGPYQITVHTEPKERTLGFAADDFIWQIPLTKTISMGRPTEMSEPPTKDDRRNLAYYFYFKKYRDAHNPYAVWERLAETLNAGKEPLQEPCDKGTNITISLLFGVEGPESIKGGDSPSPEGLPTEGTLSLERIFQLLLLDPIATGKAVTSYKHASEEKQSGPPMDLHATLKATKKIMEELRGEKFTDQMRHSKPSDPRCVGYAPLTPAVLDPILYKDDRLVVRILVGRLIALDMRRWQKEERFTAQGSLLHRRRGITGYLDGIEVIQMPTEKLEPNSFFIVYDQTEEAKTTDIGVTVSKEQSELNAKWKPRVEDTLYVKRE